MAWAQFALVSCPSCCRFHASAHFTRNKLSNHMFWPDYCRESRVGRGTGSHAAWRQPLSHRRFIRFSSAARRPCDLVHTTGDTEISRAAVRGGEPTDRRNLQRGDSPRTSNKMNPLLPEEGCPRKRVGGGSKKCPSNRPPLCIHPSLKRRGEMRAVIPLGALSKLIEPSTQPGETVTAGPSCVSPGFFLYSFLWRRFKPIMALSNVLWVCLQFASGWHFRSSPTGILMPRARCARPRHL